MVASSSKSDPDGGYEGRLVVRGFYQDAMMDMAAGVVVVVVVVGLFLNHLSKGLGQKNDVTDRRDLSLDRAMGGYRLVAGWDEEVTGQRSQRRASWKDLIKGRFQQVLARAQTCVVEDDDEGEGPSMSQGNDRERGGCDERVSAPKRDSEPLVDGFFGLSRQQRRRCRDVGIFAAVADSTRS
jgi:hypothetical protein